MAFKYYMDIAVVLFFLGAGTYSGMTKDLGVPFIWGIAFTLLLFGYGFGTCIRFFENIYRRVVLCRLSIHSTLL